MKKKEDLRIVKTKASLYRGLIELMEKKTFEEIKVSEICSISMINRSTFYDHFNDKFELLESMLSDLRVELLNSLDVESYQCDKKEFFCNALRVILNHIDNNKAVYSALAKINGNSIARDMMIDTFITYITKYLDQNHLVHSKMPTKLYVLFYASGFISVINDALKDKDGFDKDKLFQILQLFVPDNPI